VPFEKPPSEALMTVKALASYLNVHPSTIYRMMKESDLPRIKIGSDWRFSRELIDRWIKEKSYR
jgi:excisionase family DNA binding protein